MIPTAGIIMQLTPEQLQALITPIVEQAVCKALQQERKQANAESILLTHKEACAVLQVSSSTLRMWVQAGRITQVRVGKAGIRYRRSDLDQAIEQGTAFKYLQK